MQTTTTPDTPETLQTALKALGACADAREWAAGKTYAEAWAQCTNPKWLLWLLQSSDHLPAKTNEALACRFARMVLHLNADPRVLDCIEAREAWIRGEATDEQRAAASAAAWDAASAAASAAARDAASAAAWDAQCEIIRGICSPPTI